MSDLIDTTECNYLDLFQKLIPDVQIGPPGTQALIPLNIHRWPGHALATALADEPSLSSTIGIKPIENLQACFEYLSSSPTDSVYNQRFIQVLHDTAVVNFATELGGVPGTLFAGDFADHQADSYIQELIEAQISPSFEDEVYKTMRLKLRGNNTKDLIAQNSNGAAPFNGVGLTKEYLPLGDHTNPLAGLFGTNGRTNRPVWSYKGFPARGGGQIIIKYSIGTQMNQSFFA